MMPILYNLRHLLVRKVSTAFTALGIALVVFIFTSMLAFAQGFRGALVATGRPDNVMVMRAGATSELESFLTRDDAAMIRALPEIGKDAGGQPLATSDLVVVVSQMKRGTFDEPANVSVRGVSSSAFALRPRVRLADGRSFRPGLAEIVVGRSLSRRIEGAQLGGSLSFGGQEWAVVGVFEAGGSSFESEVWGDVELLVPAFDRPMVQSVTVRLSEPATFEAFERRLESDPTLEVQVERESDYYRKQSRQLVELLQTLAVFIGAVMSVGAIFGALNTMYAAVGTRTREIGTLLAIGFTPGSVLRSFLAESLLISAIGGVAGVVLALLVSHGRATGTTNWSSFSELAFKVQVTPAVMAAGLAFALAMGLVGGFFPARRAARMRPADAVRSI